MTWTDLSDDELRSRLVQRGVQPDGLYGIEWLLDNRDDNPEAIEFIKQVLD